MKRPAPRRLAFDPDADIAGALPLLLIGAVFCVATFWMLVAVHVIPVWRAIWSRTWEATTCKIIVTDAASHTSKVRGHNVRTAELSISYQYTVNGEEFSAQRYDFTGGTFDSLPQHELELLQPGSTVRCYYNPSDPSEATLTHRGFGSSLMAFLILMLNAAGPALFLEGKKIAERRKRWAFLDALTNAAGVLNVVALAVGIGLSIFAEAPLWAWLVFSALPVGMVVAYRKMPDQPATDSQR